jgi:hypothetical protein
MKERGRYQIQFMKTRSSSGVGQKVDLEFNVETLRISDLGEEEQESSFNQQKQNNGGSSSVYAGLKRTSSVSTTTDPETGEITPVDPTKGASVSKSNHSKGVADIRNILANLNSERD